MRNCMERNCLGSLAAVVLPCVAWGLHVEVPPMAMPEFADTEVTTNIPVNVFRSNGARQVAERERRPCGRRHAATRRTEGASATIASTANVTDARCPAATPTRGRPSPCRYSGAGARATGNRRINRRRRPTLGRRGILP